jgi:uncharacterized membrane protein
VGVGQKDIFTSFSWSEFNDWLPILLTIGLFGFIVSAVLKLGLLKTSLSLVDGGKPTFDDLWTTVHFLPAYFGAVILMAVPIVLGFALLIVPGIYLYVRWQFFTILIIDKNLPPIEALKESWRLTSGRVIDMFLVLVLMTALLLAGSLAFGVGLIAALPLSLIFLSQVYRVVGGKTT